MDIIHLHLHRGLSLIDSLYIARCLGCDVTPRQGTGEVRLHHPDCLDLHSVLVNGRRKDTPRHLFVFLKRIRDRVLSGEANAA